jgi:predicted acylesterase/phospholipase RssA
MIIPLRRLVLSFALLAAALLGGCGAAASLRNAPADARSAATATVPGIPSARFWGDEVPSDVAAGVRRVMPNLGRAANVRRNAEGRPLVDYLALSGGGGDGAFGAGLLAGWTKHGGRPQFDVVTGVSAGAIIAPFAFLGPRYDDAMREIWTEYTTSEIITSQIFTGILGGQSLADTAPLAALIAKYVDERMLRAIAAEYRKGRVLLIGTTNLDAQRPAIWNIGEIAVSRDPGALDLLRKVILASAAIPGAFPPVNIPVQTVRGAAEEMHVDGGVTREVFIAPAQTNLKEFDKLYDAPAVRRVFIIKNGKFGAEYEPVKPTTISISTRAVWTLTKYQNKNDVFRIWRNARDGGAEFHLAAVPDKFEVKATEAFDPKYQAALYEEGYSAGLAGGRWLTAPPDLRRGPRRP